MKAAKDRAMLEREEKIVEAMTLTEIQTMEAEK